MRKQEPMRYDPKKGTSAVDKILLRGAAAGKSPEEISALTNGLISPAKAAQRVKDILASRDWLDHIQRKQLLIDDLSELKDMLYEKAIVFKNLDAADHLIKVLNTMQMVIAEDKVDLSVALTQIRQAHAQMMLSAINLALERSLLELEKRYPAIPKGELVEIMHVSFPDVVREIESRVVEP